jgi:hypothetical protein
MGRPRGAAPIAAAALVLLSVSACYTYVPVQNPEPGTRVRVSVPVQSALDNGNAAPQTAAIEGDVVASGDTLLLAVTNRQEYGAYREVVLYDTLHLAQDQLVALEQPEFSMGRTVLLSTVITVGATVAAILAFNKDTGNDGPIDPGPPPPAPAVVVSNSLLSGVLGLLGISR